MIDVLVLYVWSLDGNIEGFKENCGWNSNNFVEEIFYVGNILDVC